MPAMGHYGALWGWPHTVTPLPLFQGCSFGYHAGGWGKPPVDETGKPLYGDVFGTNAAEFQVRPPPPHPHNPPNPWSSRGSQPPPMVLQGVSAPFNPPPMVLLWVSAPYNPPHGPPGGLSPL